MFRKGWKKKSLESGWWLNVDNDDNNDRDQWYRVQLRAIIEINFDSTYFPKWVRGMLQIRRQFRDPFNLKSRILLAMSRLEQRGTIMVIDWKQGIMIG